MRHAWRVGSGPGQARWQAEHAGLPYQTYIKSVLHEALVKRERRRAD